MLHQIKPIDGIDRLDHILEFQRRVLAFACDAQTQLPVEEKVIQAVFQTAGAWLWKKLYNNKGAQTELYKALENLIAYCQKNPAERQPLLDAFANDTQFHNFLDDPNFRFQYTIALSAATQEAVKPLMIAFYTDLLTSSGFPVEVHGQPKSLGAALLEQKANSRKYSTYRIPRSFF